PEEHFEISSRDLRNLRVYDLSNPPKINDAEFVVEIGPRPAKALTIAVDDEDLDESPLNEDQTPRATQPYLNLPFENVNEDEARWMRFIYERFLHGEEEVGEEKLSEFWKNYPAVYDPTAISPRLLIGGRHITLYGIYQLDPRSRLFELFDKVILNIRERFPAPERGMEVEAGELAYELGVPTERVVQVFRLILRFNEFTGNLVTHAVNYSIHFDRVEATRAFHRYTGLQRFMEEWLERQRPMTKTDTGTTGSASSLTADPSGVTTLPPPSAGIPLNIGKALIERKAAENMSPAMGVETLAGEIAQFIEKLETAKGQMIGIFGRWGRGKTYFMGQLEKQLKKIKGISFQLVDFNAWMYQQTPA